MQAGTLDPAQTREHDINARHTGKRGREGANEASEKSNTNEGGKTRRKDVNGRKEAA